MNKTVQDLKMEIEAMKKTQTEDILEIENLEKRTTIQGSPREYKRLSLRHRRYNRRNLCIGQIKAES